MRWLIGCVRVVCLLNLSSCRANLDAALHQALEIESKICVNDWSPSTVVRIMDFQRELDARGLNCPLPILKTKKALADMVSGQVLRVLATDPGSVRDFQAFARQTGNELVSHSEENREYVFFMRRK
jgi:tRNA 2-thiouridine synthesizing protein A